MDNWNLRSFRNDLSKFIDLIKSHRVFGDFSALDSLLSDLNTKPNINYKIENIELHVNKKPRGYRLPKDVAFYKIYLDNKIYQKDQLEIDCDPIKEYSLDINIHAFMSKIDAENEQNCYKSCWHLDQEYKEEASRRLTHPSYHFQFGGKKMIGIDHGMVAVLGSPRIPHPPMDIFLGVHFILLNFFDRKCFPFVKELIDDPDYQVIIKRAQERLWRPYFNSYNPANKHNDFVLTKTFPFYIH